MQGYFSALLHRPSLLLVVGGTATTLVAVATGMRVYDPSRVNGFVMTQELLHQTTDNLAGRDLESRKRTTGLQPERAGVIVAGALVLESVLDLSRLSSFTTGECDILEGILLDASASAGQ